MDALDGVFADITNPLEADADVLRRSFVLSDSAAELVLQQQEGEEEQEREEEEDHKDEEKEKKDEQELDKQDGENEPEEQGQEDEDKTEEPEEPSNVGSSPEVASGDQLFSSDMDLSAIPNDDTHVHDLLPGTDADTAALPTDVFGPDQAAAVSSLGTTVDLGANVEGGQDESGLSASSETGGDDTAEDSTELALTDTESRLTRSGQSYSTVPTACSTSTELCDRRKRQLEALQQRTAKSRRTTLLASNGSTPVYAIKAVYNDPPEDVTYQVQIGAREGYHEISNADVRLLREVYGHGALLDSIRSKAMERKSEVCSAISAGAKSDPTKLQPVRRVKLTAVRSHCLSHAVVNLAADNHPHLDIDRLEEVLLSSCDSDGRTTFGAVSNAVSSVRHEVRLRIRKMPQLPCGQWFGDLSLAHRQDQVLDLVAKGKMLIVDYVSKRSKAHGHVVGVANGLVYDNDENDGGVFDLKAYAEREWDGVWAARIVEHF